MRASTAVLSPCTILNTPGGKPASVSSSPSFMAESGTFSEGFSTKVLPQVMRHRKHPQRHHRREIEWRDAGTDAHRMPARLAVDARGKVLERLAHQQTGNAAGEFDHLDAALHFGPGLGHRFAVLARHQRRQFLGRALSSSRKRNMTCARSTAGVSLQAGKAPAAARTARSTSAAVQKGTWA